MTDQRTLFDAPEAPDADVLRFPVERTARHRELVARGERSVGGHAAVNNPADPFVPKPIDDPKHARKHCRSCWSTAMQAWDREYRRGPKPELRKMPKATWVLTQSGIALQSGCEMCMRRAAACR